MNACLMLLCFFISLFASAIPVSAQAVVPGAPLIKLEALHSYPHNPEHFTQGMFFYGGYLYESTGLYGKSLLASQTPQSGEIVRQVRLGPEYFGEGATLAAGRIYMLTWRENIAFIFNPDSLEVEGWFTYGGEGWGLTYDGERLIRSDGTNTLYFHGLDGQLQGTLDVYDAGEPVNSLNELEWIPEQKLILANVWHTERIAAIDPDDGQVVFWLDLSNLVPQDLRDSAEHVPNGIALAPDGKTLWLTGKLWPVIYVVAWPPVALAK